MNLKKITYLTCMIALLIFPFFYFYFLIATHLSLLSSTFAIYLVSTLLGFCFAFTNEKAAKNKLLQTDTKHSLLIIVAICLILYAFFLLLMTWSRYAGFVSESIDVFYFHQVIWQLSEFKIPYLWNLNQNLYPAWAQHFSPILIFLAPFYWISHSGGLLIMLQVVAAISGAIPIYLVATHFIKSRSIGFALSFAYLSFGGLQYGFGYGFHEILFFPILFLWAYYFYLCKNTKSYILFVILSLFVKEEVAFIMVFWGIYLILVKRDTVIGISTTVLGLFWYFLCFDIIFPYFNQGKGFGYWGQYDTAGGSGIIGIIKSTLFKPITFLQTLVTPSIKIDMMLQTFGQFAFVFLLFPPALLIIFPSLMEKLLSSGIVMANGAHYSAAIAAMTVVSTYEALPHLFKKNFINSFLTHKSIFFASLFFYCALFSTIFFGYNGYSLIPSSHATIYERGLTDDNYQFLTQVVNAIPTNATVAAQYQIGPHLNRYYINLTPWPSMTGTEDFVIIDTELLPVLGGTTQQYSDALEKLNNNKNYQLAVSNFGIFVYRKKSYIMPH